MLPPIPRSEALQTWVKSRRKLSPLPGQLSAEINTTDLFFKHTDNDVIAAATAARLVCIARSDAEDALGRASYRWRSFIFANQRY
jgi:hypothetical protein